MIWQPDETVRSVRWIHKLILLLATVLAVFAVTPDPLSRYREAARELRALERLRGFDRYVQSVSFQNSEDTVPDYYAEVLADYFGQSSIRVRRAVVVPKTLESPSDTSATVMEWVRYLDGRAHAASTANVPRGRGRT